MNATRVQVQSVLGKIANCAPQSLVLANQPKTVDYLTSIEFDKIDVANVVLALKIEDYSYGPSPSDWGNGAVWHFGKEIILHSGLVQRIYIKLNVVLDQRQLKYLTCMSFHPPERRMEFPLKNPTIIWG
jgi:hypothetical protein